MPPLEPPYTPPFPTTDGTPVQSNPFAQGFPAAQNGQGIVPTAPAAITPEGTHNAQFLDFSSDFTVEEQGLQLKVSLTTSPSPFVPAGQGNLSVDMTSGSVSLSTSQQQNYGAYTTSGAMVVDANLVFNTPATEAASFMRLIRNDCTGNGNVVVKVAAGGNSVSVAPGGRLLVFIQPGGVTEAVTAV